MNSTITNSRYKTIVVQEAVSRNESIRNKISDEAWLHNGLSVFSTETIPYSGRTGDVFAQKIITAFLNRFKQIINMRGELHFYEFGVGTGVLSKKILDQMSLQHPSIYSRMKIHISDISSKSITTIQNLKIFSDHDGHVCYEILDAASPEFPTTPDFIFHTYLVDSLPTKHYRITDSGELFEIRVKTEIPADAQLIDTTVLPPEILDANSILLVLTGENHKKRQLLAHKLLELIIETEVDIPIKDIDLIDDEYDKLYSFISKQSGPGKFNYSYLAIKSIEQAISAIPDNGVIFISDFGYTEIYCSGDLFTRFGNAMACPVCFPALTHSAHEAGGHATLAKHQEGYPHELLICRNPDTELERIFSNTFREYGGEVISSFVEEYTSILNSEKHDKSRNIRRLFNKLPDNHKSDHELLTNLANALVKYGLNSDAVQFCDLALTDYSHVGGAAYRIKGRALVKLGKPDAAVVSFRKALKIAENDDKAYLYLSRLYWQQKNIEQFIKTMWCYVKYSRNDDLLRTLSDIATVLKISGKQSEHLDVIRMIHNLESKYKFTRPSSSNNCTPRLPE